MLFRSKNVEVRVMWAGPNEERREIRIENDRRAFLGVATENSENGAIVKEVVSGSPAEKAGLLSDDRITSVDGQKVDGPESLIKIIGDHKPGDKVNVAWTRGKKSMKSDIVLDKPQAPRIVEGFKIPGMPDPTTESGTRRSARVTPRVRGSRFQPSPSGGNRGRCSDR